MQKVELHIKKGFSTVEIVLAIAVFSLLVLGLAGGLLYSVQSTKVIGLNNKANYLADEGIEAVRNIRDENFANLVNGTYGLSIVSNRWTLTGSQDVTDNFTRVITISTVDTYTKKVTSRVTWPKQNSKVNSVSTSVQLTDWRRVVVIASWLGATQSSVVNISGNEDGKRVQTLGTKAYVIRNNGSPDFQIIDITTPSAPVLNGSLSLAGTPVDLAVLGNYAYVLSGDDNNELQVINISTPSTPVVSTTLNLAGNADPTGIFINGNYAYISRVNGTGTQREFSIINITNPLVPTVTGALDLTGTPTDVFVLGNYAYLSNNGTATELQIVNITTPASPTLTTTFNVTGNFVCNTITGFTNRVFLGCGNELIAINTTSVATPVTLGTFTPTGVVNDIVLNSDNTLLFLATSNTTAEFRVLNISNPALMTSVTTLNTTGAANGITYDLIRLKVYLVTAADAEEFIILSST